MIVAVTGATGFVGSRTLDLLLAAGHAVRALTRRAQPPRDRLDWTAGALDDETALADLCRGADAAIHIAGIVNAPDAAGFDAGNRVGTLHMLHAAESAGVDRFVHISSLAAREPDLSIYGRSKRAAEDAVATSTRDWIVIRPPAVYGPGDTEMRDMFRMAKRGIVMLPPKGRASFIHVDDLARLIVAAAAATQSHQIWEVDDGREGGWTHADFARALGSAVGRRVARIAVPKPALMLAAGADRLARGSRAKLTYDRVGYLSHADWAVDPAKRPPAELWMPLIETGNGLADTAAAYRMKGWL